MDQTFYIPDAAIDWSNITFVRTGNCISDTERHCGNHKTGEICRSPLSVHMNQEEPAKERLLT